MRNAAPAPVLLAVAQALVEGSRWQLVPAYALVAALQVHWGFSYWHTRRRPTGALIGRRRLRVLRNGVAAALGVLTLGLAFAVPLAVPVFRFPEPSGPYGIGTVTYHWVDEDRPELFTEDPQDRREIVVQLWYPARPDPTASRVAYVPDAEILSPLAELVGLPHFTLSHLRYVRTHAVASAPVADGRPYPLLVLATGRGGYRQYNTLGVQELVSRGYIVAAIDHPYSDAGVVFPDGRLVTLDPRMLDGDFVDSMLSFIAGDASFTLDRVTALNIADPHGVLTGRIDVSRVGLFGLSLGGEITAEGCLNDERFRACLPIDCWMTPPVIERGLQQPTMWLTRDADTMRREGWTEEDIVRAQTTIQTVFDRMPADGYIVRVRGMYHPDFADTQLLSPLGPRLGLTGSVPAQRSHEIVNSYVVGFFDHYVRNLPAPLLTVPQQRYSEVIIDVRRPT
jgi:predicted dienelactone hydrolase